MTIEQKMRDEYRIGYLDGKEEGLKESREEMLRISISALKGVLEPTTIAERLKIPLAQVMDILDQT